MIRRPLVAAAAATLALAAPAVAGAHGGGHGHGGHGGHGGWHGQPSAPACSPNADLLGFTDALDKTTYRGTDVGGLSALSLADGGWRGADRARVLVDNQGTTPARFYDLELRERRGQLDARVDGVTQLRRADGTPYTGADLDGEGLVALPDGSLLVSSETEPSIRRFSRSGRQVGGELPVPARFGVAPAGEAARNQTFEGLALSPDGRTLWAGMEGPLSGDGATDRGEARLRLLRWERDRRGDWQPAGQFAYLADPGLAITELVVADDGLLVLERGFAAGVGNTIRVHQAFPFGADDVSEEATLSRDGIRFVAKRELLDLGDCPPGDATNPGAQANPLLDNVEGMALGERLGDGARQLLLLSDDNWSATQVTRLYSLRVRLHGEPTLLARATYGATEWQPGPASGRVGVGAANGIVPPFPGQPVPGFSGALDDGRGGFWGMPDNGFGSQGNSADFLLRMYHVTPRWKTAWGGAGRLVLDRFVSLRDPDRKIPFPIVNEETDERLLTGADFDLESVQRDRRGNLWFGEEFGPYLLQTSPDGRVLRAPIPLPGVKAPQSHELAPGEPFNLPSSRGFEPLAISRDGRTLYPILEGALESDADKTLRRIYEFDVAAGAYTGRSWSLHLSAERDDLVVGDAQMLSGNRLLLIERDNAEGVAARVKRLIEVDLDAAPAADGTLPTRPVLDLLRIRDPRGVSAPVPAGGIGLGDPFGFPLQSVETVVPLGGDRLLLANDNNFPGNSGRVPGVADDVEAVVIEVPGFRD